MIVIDYLFLVNKSSKESLYQKKWFYLGTDYKKIKVLQNSFLKADGYVDVFHELKSIQEEYKQEFIDFIGSLSVKYDSFQWWASSVSEKGMFEGQPLFMEFCYFKLIKQYMNQDVLIVLDNLTLLEAVQQNYNVKTYIYQKSSYIAEIIGYFKSRAKFFIMHFFRKKAPDCYISGKKYIGLISWVDDRNTESGDFEDSYFGKLFSSKKNNDEFLYLPNFIFRKYKDEAFAALRKESINYFSLFDNFTKLDVLKALFLSMGFNFDKNEKFIFDGENVSLFIKQKLKDDWLANRLSKYYLLYFAVKCLKQKGVFLDKVVYLFENQPWEKILCYSFKEFYPEVELIGFMHSVTLPYLLSLYPSQNEREIMPQPDKIFTTGQLFSEELRKYYDKTKIEDACAFRYEYCFENKVISKNKKNVILVALASDVEKKAEMIDKIYYAYKDKKEYRVLIKDHPANPANLESIFNNELPDNFEIVNQPISELLSSSSLVINADSTVGFEALKFRVPVIEILFNVNSNMSPIDYFQGKKYKCLTPNEILDTTNTILNMPHDEKNKYFLEVDSFLESCFNPIKDEYIAKICNKRQKEYF